MKVTQLFIISAIATLTVATPTGGSGSIKRADSCSTGPIQCCKHVEKASDPDAKKVIKELNIPIKDENTKVGLTCSPITVIGGGNGGCTTNSVCCEDNSHGGAISVGCVPTKP
ncbi:hypothetical protein PQX77_008698 [Marasmius sp. AFHP31]|nr:hypothetical protein PQX77_008698 [Marasmius sp. AFHP31]